MRLWDAIGAEMELADCVRRGAELRLSPVDFWWFVRNLDAKIVSRRTGSQIEEVVEDLEGRVIMVSDPRETRKWTL